MNRLPKGISKNTETHEVVPLLKDEACAIDSDLYAIGGASGFTKEAIDESQTDNDKIVETLFLAWLHFFMRKPDKPEHEDSELIGPEALNAMYTAWQQIIAERDNLPNPGEIIQDLAASMVDYMYPLKLMVPEDVTREAFTAHVEKIVRKSWRQMRDRIAKEAKEKAKKRKERRRRIRERIRRRHEIQEVLWFYEPFARMDNHVPLSCRIFCLFLCECCSIFLFQFPIHILLLTWPLSIGIMGGIFLTQCPVNHLMMYVMMAMGAVGTIALLIRLSFIVYQKFSDSEMRWWPWIVLKLIEFTFLDLLLIQLYYFYSETPSFVPGSPKYCNKTFYTFVHWINIVSMTLVSAWIFVYITKGILWLRCRKFDLHAR